MSTALQENGWVCGKNTHGKLGIPNKASVDVPTPLKSRRWKSISFGDGHAAGVGDGGEVYTWGCNDKGQLGGPGGPDAGSWQIPRRMEVLYGWEVRGVACGSEHTVAITSTDVITWGSNEHGQCGHGERSERDWVKPRSLKALNGHLVAQVVCGRHHTLCVTATSVVYAWGANSCGQLGLGDTAHRRSPCIVSALWALPVLQLAAGDAHSVALTSNGFLFSWGDNEQGQLGLPADAERAQQVAALRTASERKRVVRRVNQRFLQAMGEMGIPREQAELALAETGNVGVEVATEWLFSLPDDVLETHLSCTLPDSPSSSLDVVPALPTGHTIVTLPRRVPLQGVRTMAAGAMHTVAATDEEVYAWGDNVFSQLGIGSHIMCAQQPVEIQDLRGAGVSMVAAGARHTIFLSRDGTAYGCGDASHGALCFDSAVLNAENPESDSSGIPNRKKAALMPPQFANDAASSSSGSFLTAQDGSEPSASASGTKQSGWQQGAKNPFAPASMPSIIPYPLPMELDFMHHRFNPHPHKCMALSYVVAGTGCTAFLTRAADELPDEPLPRLWEKLQQAIITSSQTPLLDINTHIRPIAVAVERMFGSAAALSAAFGKYGTVGIDPVLLDSVQASVLELEQEFMVQQQSPKEDELFTAFRKAAEALVIDLEANIKLLGTPERAQVLLAALQSPLLGDPRSGSFLIPRLCNIVLAAPPSCRHLLVQWWAEYPPELLQSRVVRPLQRYLTDELYATKKLTVAVMNAIRTLAQVEEANQLGRRLPPEAFYNELISEKLDVLDHYVAWRQTHDMPQHANSADGPFSFCSYPFLLNPRAKSKLLHTEARIQMDQTVADARAAYLSGGSTEDFDRVVPHSKAGCMSQPRPVQANSSTMYNAATGRSWGQDRTGQTLALPHTSHNSSSRRRRDRGSGGGLRWLFRGGHNNSTAMLPTPEDEPTHTATLSSERSGQSSTSGQPTSSHGDDGQEEEDSLRVLARQGSLGLPCPEESGFPATHPDMCIIRVRRGHLLEDALDEVARQRPRDLFKPLRVHFIGEDGVDAGGVKKEFFQLLMTELLCADYGMLRHQPESNTYWFDPATMESDDEFLLLGLVVGLAVYNGVLLDFPLPLVLYRKILGQEVGLRDLEEMQPMLGRSLRQLLQYDDSSVSVADVFCQTFSLEVTMHGDVKIVDLCPGGRDITVTEDNRREFVDHYVDWWLNVSVFRQFEAFAKGFLMLCGGPALQLFSATELERLVCGSPCLDFDALVRSARYEGGYHPEHRVVQWLWQVVVGLSAEEKKMFLKFFTGSDRAPIGGLANLRVVIQRDGADSNKLPTSHTCFNTLLLPSYRSKEKLEDRLKLAILNAEGFGLE